MIKCTVDRKTWYRGCGRDSSRLLRNDGQRCCMGFLANILGEPDENILNRLTFKYIPGALGLFEECNEHHMSKLYKINDDVCITDKDREGRITELGKHIGVEFTFIN